MTSFPLSSGFGFYRHLRERGFVCDVVASGLAPSSPGDRIKTDWRDSRKLAPLETIDVPSPELRRCAISCVRGRTRGWIG